MYVRDPLGCTRGYMEALEQREQSLAMMKRLGGSAEAIAARTAALDEGVEHARHNAERQQQLLARNFAPQPATVSGQLPDQVVSALQSGSSDALELSRELQGMIRQVAQINNLAAQLTPEEIAEVHYQVHSEEAAERVIQGRHERLARLRPEQLQDMDQVLRDEGFTVEGEIFTQAADGTYQLGNATISGNGFTLRMDPETGFAVTLDHADTVSVPALPPPDYRAPPASLPDGQQAKAVVREADQAIDMALAKMDMHNALVNSVKPEAVEAIRQRKGETAARLFCIETYHKISELAFDPAELERTIEAKGLSFGGTFASKQTDGTFRMDHFMIHATLTGGSNLAYDSIAGAYLGTTDRDLYKVPSKDRSHTAMPAQPVRVCA